MKNALIIVAVAIFMTASGLALGTAPVAAPEKHDHRRPVCAVTGKVTAVQSVEKTPWTDGTPSTLTITEVHITVALEDRRPQRANAPAEECTLPGGTASIYKLCSPTLVKTGDMIVGIEGLATGTDTAVGCLFDVAVVTPPATPADK